ncbi:MAG: biopolymer transporter ExbD [Elusimicrobiales bacterium]|nr:biopolymer transporter ExbD [Elusimicrobiales bacterium]
MQLRKHSHSVLAEINMIPLIDVSLILLIIFMVMTPFLVQSQISVQLPKSSQGAQAQEDGILRVQIAADGRVTVEGKQVALAALERELLLRLSKASRRTVLVQADRAVPVEKVIQVFDAAKKLGAGKLGIAVTRQ